MPPTACTTVGKPLMSKSKDTAAKPIADVSHPDNSPSDKTSRPVIITNRPIMKDPMMVDDETAKPEPLSVDNLASEVKPLTAPTLKEDKPAKKPAKAIEEEPKPDVKPEAEPEPEAETETSDDDTPPTDEPKTDKPEPDAEEKSPTNPKADQVAAKAKQQAEADLQKLADSKQYFLPINSVEQRRTKRFIVLGIVLSLLLAVAWADIALDAGLIHVNGVKAVTHFFST
jgi:hypothetical protein